MAALESSHDVLIRRSIRARVCGAKCGPASHMLNVEGADVQLQSSLFIDTHEQKKKVNLLIGHSARDNIQLRFLAGHLEKSLTAIKRPFIGQQRTIRGPLRVAKKKIESYAILLSTDATTSAHR